jgi:hypothetical protein
MSSLLTCFQLARLPRFIRRAAANHWTASV